MGRKRFEKNIAGTPVGVPKVFGLRKVVRFVDIGRQLPIKNHHNQQDRNHFGNGHQRTTQSASQDNSFIRRRLLQINCSQVNHVSRNQNGYGMWNRDLPHLRSSGKPPMIIVIGFDYTDQDRCQPKYVDYQMASSISAFPITPKLLLLFE